MIAKHMFVKQTNTPRASLITKTTETLAAINQNLIILGITLRRIIRNPPYSEIFSSEYGFRVIMRINNLKRTQTMRHHKRLPPTSKIWV